MKTLLVEVEVSKTSTQVTKVLVPVTIESNVTDGRVWVIDKDIANLARMKASDVVRGKITVADPFEWTDVSPDLELLRFGKMKVISEMEPAPPDVSLAALISTFRLSCSFTGKWPEFTEKRREQVIDGMRWLNRNAHAMSGDTERCYGYLKDAMRKIGVPEEVIGWTG